MSNEICSAYRTNPEVLGIFAVAAYNGGPRNVASCAARASSPRAPQSPAPVSGARKPLWCEQSAFRVTTAKIAATSKSIKGSSACSIEPAWAEMAGLTRVRQELGINAMDGAAVDWKVDNLVDWRVAASDPSDACRQQLGSVGNCEGLFPRPFAASLVVC